jgi:hypothetical protein
VPRPIWRAFPDGGGSTELIEDGPEAETLVILEFADFRSGEALVRFTGSAGALRLAQRKLSGALQS